MLTPGRLALSAAAAAALLSAAVSQPPVVLDKNLEARMRDGIVLRADVYRPAALGRFPVLLQRTPYSKHSRSAEAGFRALASRGFVVIVQDTRGRYTSDGVARPHDEADDGVETVAWARELPYSNGRIGMFGGSYLATTQLLAASRAPDGLVALFPSSSYASRYDMVFQGGAFYLGDGLSWNLGQAMDVRRRVLTPEASRDGAIGLDAASRRLLSDRWLWQMPLKSMNELDLQTYAPGYRQMLDHPSFDAFWETFDIAARHDRFTAPAFHLTGWYDTLLTGTLRNFTGLRARAATDDARRHQRLIVGPWTHARPTPETTRIGDVDFGPSAGFDAEALRDAWFEYWLGATRPIGFPRAAGAAYEPARTSPVRLFVMGENAWRDEEAWPLARARATPFYLSSGGRANTREGDGVLSLAEPAADSTPDRFVYDPDHPVPTGAAGGYSRRPSDERENEMRPDVLVYTTPPLDRDVEVTGPVTLTLWIASSAPDTDFTARLVDVFPDGTARALTDGILRARYRRGPSAPILLTPGEPTELTIDVGATSNLFRAGHRIRLDVSSSNFPRFDRNPNTGGPFGEDVATRRAEQTVFHDRARPSRLILPVVPR